MQELSQTQFEEIWQSLYSYSLNTQTSINMGIDLSQWDKRLYNIIIMLLKTYYNEAQVDFIIYSIFDENPEIEIEEGEKIFLYTPEIIWLYLQKLKTIPENA